MKKHVVQVLISIVLFFVVFLSYQCYTLNSRVQRLESEIKLSSSHSSKSNANLNQLEYRVSKLTEDKDFFKSIYFDNGSWFIGFVSLVVVLAVGFSIYSNKNDLKGAEETASDKMKQFEKELESKIKDIFKPDFKNIYIDLYGNTAIVFQQNALLCKENERKKEKDKQDLTNYLYFMSIHLYSHLKQDEGNYKHSLDTLDKLLEIINNPETRNLKSAKITTVLVRLNEFNIPSITEKVSEILTALDQRT